MELIDEIHLLPPVRGVCRECGARHAPGKHDEKSAWYRLRRMQREKELMTMKSWIPKHVRMPQEADADVQGCVLAWHLLQGAMVIGWHQLENNELLTHWMQTPKAPEDAKQLADAYNRRLVGKYGCGLDGKLPKNK